jgi:F0F1-type ATP synthase assembly protein I
MTPTDPDENLKDQAQGLKERIASYEAKHQKPPSPNAVEDLVQAQRGISFAITIIIELIVPVAVGGVVGRQLDLWLGYKAFFLFIFILLGLGVAFIQIKRLAEGKDDLSSFPPRRSVKKAPPKDHG